MKILSFKPHTVLSKRKLIGSGLIAFIGGILLGGALLNLSSMPPYYSASTELLQKFSSYADLVNFVSTNIQSSSDKYRYFEEGLFFQSGATFTQSATNDQSYSGPDYSSTNLQVEGVDEADIVKTDGKHIYVVSGQKIFILNITAMGELEVLSHVELNETLHGIFLNGDKLVVFGSSSHEVSFADMSRFYLWPYYSTYYAPKTLITVYDVTDKTSPTLTRNVTVDGYYFNTRMIGDYVYCIANEPVILNGNEVKLPIIETHSTFLQIPATDIHYTNTSDFAYTFTTIVAINSQNDAEEPTHKTLMIGATSSMYVSLNNIYITLPKYSEGERTLIYRILVDKDKIETAASGEVPGMVLNQFSMDEYDGHFRIATTTGTPWDRSSLNHVYVLNMSLKIVGELEGLAQGETIYSARFMGDKFYLVTFRKVDPLFVIDLQDPENPEVLGELKITGYSDYLHPYDENHVIGVGKETIAAEEGDFSWYQGVKISLFDVSDPLNPTEVDKDEIGDRGTTSPVLSDHKAFLFSRERQLLVIPVLVAEIDESKYPEGVPSWTSGDYVWQGAYVYNITTQGLELRGTITHIENGLQSNIYYSSPYSVKRTLYIDNVLYTISDKIVKMNSLATLEEIGKIELP